MLLSAEKRNGISSNPGLIKVKDTSYVSSQNEQFLDILFDNSVTRPTCTLSKIPLFVVLKAKIFHPQWKEMGTLIVARLIVVILRKLKNCIVLSLEHCHDP